MITTDQLLERGYFPRELPPPFETASFAQYVRTKSTSGSVWPASLMVAIKGWVGKHSTAEMCVHTLSRYGNLGQRRLGIANPLFQAQVAHEIATGWNELSGIHQRSRSSLSKPVVDTSRSLRPKAEPSLVEPHSLALRTGYRYLVQTDVLSFYPSIYTHSIPWALHTKDVAKNQRDDSLLGNRIDKAVRNSQHGQTIGIPIGPDTSFAIAETILSAVDSQLQDRLNGGYARHLDDIECAVGTYSEAESALGEIRAALAPYELGLNPLKTRILELPQRIEPAWVCRLRQFKIRPASGQAIDLQTFFDLAFELRSEHPKQPVLSYAVGLIGKRELKRSNRGRLQLLLLQSAVVEPETLPAVVRILKKNQDQGMSLSEEPLKRSLFAIMTAAARESCASDLAWALWAAILFRIELSSEAAASVSSSMDDVVILLALDARSRGLMPSAWAIPQAWTDMVTPYSLIEKHWLAVYEAVRRGLLPDCQATIWNTPFFDELRQANVQFYNSQPNSNEITGTDSRAFSGVRTAFGGGAVISLT